MAIKLKKTVKSFSNNYVNDDVLSRLRIHLGKRYDLVPDSPTETKNGLVYGGVLAYKKGSKHSMRDLAFYIKTKDYVDYGPNEKLRSEIDEIVENSFEEVNKKFSSTKPAWDELENCIKENCSEPIKKLIEAGESQDKIKDTVNYIIDHIMEGDSEKKEFSEDKEADFYIYDVHRLDDISILSDDEFIVKDIDEDEDEARVRGYEKDVANFCRRNNLSYDKC